MDMIGKIRRKSMRDEMTHSAIAKASGLSRNRHSSRCCCKRWGERGGRRKAIEEREQQVRRAVQARVARGE